VNDLVIEPIRNGGRHAGERNDRAGGRGRFQRKIAQGRFIREGDGQESLLAYLGYARFLVVVDPGAKLLAESDGGGIFAETATSSSRCNR
jgi:hypothetical protein